MVIDTQIPNSCRTGQVVFYTEFFKEAVRVRLDVQDQLVDPRYPREMASVVWFQDNVNVSRQTQEGRPYRWSRLWVSLTSLSPSWSQDETKSCIKGAEVEQNVFFPNLYFWSNISKHRSSKQRQAVFRPPFEVASAAQRHFDRCPLVFGFWRKLPSIKSLRVQIDLLHCTLRKCREIRKWA